LSRLVIHAPNWLGDSIMARGFVAAALDCHDAQNAVIVAHRRVAPLWRAWPGLSVVESASGHWLSDAASTARRIRGLGAHACSYTLSASLRSALTLAWAGIPERIGFAWGGRSWLLSRPVSRLPSGTCHYSDEFFNLLPEKLARIPTPPLWNWPSNTESTLGRLLAGFQCEPDGCVVIAVGASGAAKQYPAPLWRRALSTLRTDRPVVLIGTGGDTGSARDVASGLPCKVMNLCGQTSLAQLAVLLSKAAAFAGVDSGAAHLAAAVGCPSLVLFGPGDPAETLPRGRHVQLLSAGLWCSPCRSRKCLRTDYPSECMDLIAPEHVSAGLGDLIRQHASR
jgi:ADP-heptose:LPS heptosyltransferase